MNLLRTLPIGLAAVAAFAACGGTGDSDGGKKMTLTEAACQLLGDGETSESTYAVMKDLAADHPLAYGEDESVAARIAVNAAIDQGCG